MMTVELTPAELEMIKITREKEELRKREEEVAKQAKIEKNKVYIADRIAKAEAGCKAQVAAVKKFAKEFPAGWQVKESTREEKVYGMAYDHSEDNIGRYQHSNAELVYDKYTVRVKLNKTDWAMFLDGPGVDYRYSNKAITKPSTIVKKVTDLIDDANAKQVLELKQANAVESTIARMKELYPDARVTSGRQSEVQNSFSRHREYVSFDAVTIKYENGIEIVFRVYADGSLGRKSINFGNTNEWALMDKLSKI